MLSSLLVLRDEVCDRGIVFATLQRAGSRMGWDNESAPDGGKHRSKQWSLMSELGQERRIWAFLGMSAVTLIADICLRRNI